MDRFPVYTAQFTPDGQKILIASKQRHFYVFDMFSAEMKKIPGIKGRSEHDNKNFWDLFYFMKMESNCDQSYLKGILMRLPLPTL